MLIRMQQFFLPSGDTATLLLILLAGNSASGPIIDLTGAFIFSSVTRNAL